MPIRIRKAKITDAPALAVLIHSLGLFPRLAAETLDQTEERLRRHLALACADDSHLILLARASDGAIAGFCAVHWLPYLILTGPEGYVSELFIQDDYRGQGLGSQLLEVVKQEARERGCSRLMLINMRARESYRRQFYATRGWQERPDAANFVFDLSAPAE